MPLLPFFIVQRHDYFRIARITVQQSEKQSGNYVIVVFIAHYYYYDIVLVLWGISDQPVLWIR